MPTESLWSASNEFRQIEEDINPLEKGSLFQSFHPQLISKQFDTSLPLEHELLRGFFLKRRRFCTL